MKEIMSKKRFFKNNMILFITCEHEISFISKLNVTCDHKESSFLTEKLISKKQIMDHMWCDVRERNDFSKKLTDFHIGHKKSTFSADRRKKYYRNKLFERIYNLQCDREKSSFS